MYNHLTVTTYPATSEMHLPRLEPRPNTELRKENGTFERAIGEIRAGRKSSCWMWFVIPSPPHMKNNVEHGSSMNRKYLGNCFFGRRAKAEKPDKWRNCGKCSQVC